LSALPAHFERFLGSMDGGWTKNESGRRLPFQVARYPNAGVESVAFATLGLNAIRLRSPRSGRTLHQELLMLVSSALREGPVPSILQQVGLELIERGEALLRGQVLTRQGYILGSKMSSLYCAIPVHLPPEFVAVREANRDVAIVWLVPIGAREASYINEVGWEGFEAKLDEVGPNLLDPFRPSIL